MKPDVQMSRIADDQHLQLLSIFHYVLAGITALCSLFPIFHFFMGVLMLSGAFEGADDQQFPATIFGLMFVIIPALIIASAWPWRCRSLLPGASWLADVDTHSVWSLGHSSVVSFPLARCWAFSQSSSWCAPV